MSVSMCGYLLHTSYAKWQFNPDIGFLKKIKPVQEVPFPALTICPQTKAQKTLTSFESNYRRYFEDGEVHGDSYIESKYFEYLLHVCDPQLLNNFNLNVSLLTNGSELVPHLRNILTDLDYSLMFCKWRDNYVDCSDIFNEIITDQGICFSFNMLHHQELFNGEMCESFEVLGFRNYFCLFTFKSQGL